MITEAKLEKLIGQLDTAVGMLLVTAMKNKEVEQAMRIVSDVSFQLGFLLDDED